MKTTIASLLTLFAFAMAVEAEEVSVKLSDVHLCCKACVTGANQAAAKATGVKAAADQESETVTLTGPDKASVQKAVDALVAAGYFGKSADADIKVAADTGAKGQKVQTLKVEGVHLCCGQCVSAINRVVKDTPGATAHTATKNAKTFEVTGDFNDKEFFDALQKNGLSGKVAK